MMVRHADIEAGADLVYDGYAPGSLFKVKGADGRDVVVTITYQFVSEKLFAGLSAQIGGFLGKDLGGELGLSVSKDGGHWIGGNLFRTQELQGKWQVVVRAGEVVNQKLPSDRTSAGGPACGRRAY